ncbi:MAG TPA: collagen-like protein [Oscillospiraceae bacterium]|nr:collagen-like protein [Oscillospiraceae bacterium]
MTDNLITLQEEAILKEFGLQGPPGRGAYVYIKWAAAEPTADGDMKDTADTWIGICSVNSATAPTAYTAYTWYQYKGATGAIGATGPTGATGPAGPTGATGANAYIHIKWAAAQPDSDDDMKDTADAWLGVYWGASATAPTAYTAYAWQNIGDAADYAKEIDGQTELTTLSDADEIPVYDAANTVQKKTLWSTVKTALAALFVSKDTSGNVLVAGKQVKNAILETVTTFLFSGATAGRIQFYYPTAEPFGRVLLYGRGGAARFLTDSTEVAQKTVGSILYNYQNNGGAL